VQVSELEDDIAEMKMIFREQLEEAMRQLKLAQSKDCTADRTA
jgi:hypothetical protein